jgi:hypothetical protein
MSTKLVFSEVTMLVLSGMCQELAIVPLRDNSSNRRVPRRLKGYCKAKLTLPTRIHIAALT